MKRIPKSYLTVNQSYMYSDSLKSRRDNYYKSVDAEFSDELSFESIYQDEIRKGKGMDKLVQAAAMGSAITPEFVSSMLVDTLTPDNAEGHIWWRFNDKPYDKHFNIKDLSVEKVMEQFADEFANIPFNCTNAWIGISNGCVCSMLPVGHIDIYTCAEMDAHMLDRRYMRMWIENKYAIPNYSKVELGRGTYSYIIQHKRL